MLRRINVAVWMVILIFVLVGCSANNEEMIGEWYNPDTNLEGTFYRFEEDGEWTYFVDSQIVAAGTYSVKSKDPVTIVFKENGKTIQESTIGREDNFTCLYLNDSMTLVKGHDDALSYKELYCEPDIWTYDFTGDYYEAADSSLSGLSEYEQMVKIKTDGGTVDQTHGGFTLRNGYSGYYYGAHDTAVTIDIDRNNMIMHMTDPWGFTDDYRIEYCEETKEFYFVSDALEDYYFKVENVQE